MKMMFWEHLTKEQKILDLKIKKNMMKISIIRQDHADEEKLDMIRAMRI